MGQVQSNHGPGRRNREQKVERAKAARIPWSSSWCRSRLHRSGHRRRACGKSPRWPGKSRGGVLVQRQWTCAHKLQQPAQRCCNHRISRGHLQYQLTNGDETRDANRIGNYSKGLVHNSIGQVTNFSYNSLLAAVNSGAPELFSQFQLGGNTPLVDPQAGLAFDLEGTDSHQLAIGTPASRLQASKSPGRRGCGKLLDGVVARRRFHAIRQ